MRFYKNNLDNDGSLNNKGNGGNFRSPVQLETANEFLYRKTAGLETRDLSLAGDPALQVERQPSKATQDIMNNIFGKAGR